ncbi:hypothetical protein RFI_01288, partial [Reticulomyxa filosa]
NSVGNSNVICSGSDDSTIRFWDIRSNKNQLYVIEGDDEDDGIFCLKFIVLKKKDKTNDVTYDLNLCYGSCKGTIRIWGYKLTLNLFDLIEYTLKEVFILRLMFFKELKSIINENCTLYFMEHQQCKNIIKRKRIYDFDEIISENVKLFNNIMLNLV